VHSTGNNYDEQRIYELIWKRAAASQMADAQLEKTTATIGISTATEKLVAHGEVIKFDGFLKVYMESTDDEQEEEAKDMLPPLKIGQALSLNRIYSRESFTRPPARFTEASLVKKLEEMGIGRPSTYAPTISTIQKREYVLKENREGSERPFKELILRNDEVKRQVGRENTGAEKAKLFPTNMAMVVNDYLTDHFEDVLEYSFTANVEERFDKIAHHKEDWQAMIKSFYDPFHHLVEKALEEDRPDTKRELGLDPKTGLPVFVSLGKFGPYAQLGQNSDEEGAEKPKYASLKKGQLLESISLDQALELFKLPREVGLYKDGEIIVADGRYGPYIKYNGKFVSLPKGSDPLSIDIEECISLIKQKEEADAPIYVYQDKPVQKGKGRFGPFIKWDNMFINVNKKYDWDNLSSQDIEELIEDKLKKEREKLIHHWEEEGIRVEKARWGRHNIIQGKTKIELPKTVDVSEMTLEEAQAYIEKNSPKKKSKAKSKS
jgi:DNA topoisomerase-1